MESRARSRSAWGTLPTALAVVAALVCVTVVVLWNAPANWLAASVAQRTGGVVLLADAEGTIRSGSAVLALGKASDPTVRLALPGRITWRLEFGPALAPVLHLTHDGVLQQPVAVHYASGGLAVDPGAAILPASLLELAGPPLNTLRPEGRCTVLWQSLTVDGAGDVIGTGTLRVEGFALSLSPVRPLGDYLVDWSSTAQGATWRLATESGPLELNGDGAIGATHARGTRLRVTARPSATASLAVARQLAPLLDMIGRHGTNEAVIESGRSP